MKELSFPEIDAGRLAAAMEEADFTSPATWKVCGCSSAFELNAALVLIVIFTIANIIIYCRKN